MWHVAVVLLGSDRYHELQELGAEPTNVLLMPDPRPPQGLATPDGAGTLQSCVTFVGLKWYEDTKNLTGGA
jgi:hypothetical protein